MGLKYVGKSEVIREWTDKDGKRHRETRPTASPIEHAVPLRDVEDGEMAGFGGKAYLLKTGLWEDEGDGKAKPEAKPRKRKSHKAKPEDAPVEEISGTVEHTEQEPEAPFELPPFDGEIEREFPATT